jgi:hypothetical protein
VSLDLCIVVKARIEIPQSLVDDAIEDEGLCSIGKKYPLVFLLESCHSQSPVLACTTYGW